MSSVTTFTIIRGQDLIFDIIIKENGTTMPLVLSDSDAFTYDLVSKDHGTVYANNVPMTVVDGLNGRVRGVITAIVSNGLPSKYGAKEDYYIDRPSLRLAISGTSAVQGQMTAFIENVYVTA